MTLVKIGIARLLRLDRMAGRYPWRH